MVGLFFVLLICGLLLIGIEVFVPGAILGTLGAVALLCAAVTGFLAFGTEAGAYIALSILILAGIVLALWIKFFPGSSIGKKMTVAHDLSLSKTTAGEMDQLQGKEGEALSDLRPAGFALFQGRRMDVVTQGEMIRKGEVVRVAQVEGNRIVVARVAARNTVQTT